MVLFRACVYSLKILDPDEDLDKGFTGELLNSLEGEGLISLRYYGAPTANPDNKFILLRFDLDDLNKIEQINDLLVSYLPTYCFRHECPGSDINCPAFNR